MVLLNEFILFGALRNCHCKSQSHCECATSATLAYIPLRTVFNVHSLSHSSHFIRLSHIVNFTSTESPQQQQQQHMMKINKCFFPVHFPSTWHTHTHIYIKSGISVGLSKSRLVITTDHIYSVFICSKYQKPLTQTKTKTKEKNGKKTEKPKKNFPCAYHFKHFPSERFPVLSKAGRFSNKPTLLIPTYQWS